MKLLTIAEHDPAGVCLGHRDLLRAAGHDARVALHIAWSKRQQDADWIHSDAADGLTNEPTRARGDTLELYDFAQKADVIQVCPAIPSPAPPNEWGLEIGRIVVKRRLPIAAFFHGSRIAWQTRAVLKNEYKHCARAASTLNYVTSMDATWLPPYVPLPTIAASLRTSDDPLIIAHAPTDRVQCSTNTFLEVAGREGAVIELMEGVPHEEVMRRKMLCNAGFDHLRGDFSVNTLENCALGLAPLISMTEENRKAMEAAGVLWAPTTIDPNAAGLARGIQFLEKHTASVQQDALRWFLSYFSAEEITRRLEEFYFGI